MRCETAVLPAGSKIQALISELSELVQLPCPTAADLSLDGLCKWAPDEVVDKVGGWCGI